MQREEPYLALTCRELSRDGLVPSGTRTQLPARNGGNSKETAGDKPEEGGDDVKSSWPLRPGLHTYYNGRDRGLQAGDGKPIPETLSQSGLESATRLHEVGIASNRRSALLR
ncbi:unnamed protein product [Brugia timori]|uniref:Uncharacterized protein n=1 Tax=Brugia timori TaxID=42155 RepID=A0A0R3R948_9BILA|nr:unnamed protein product [Brugia timori]